MPDQCSRCRFFSEDMRMRDPADAAWGFGWCRRRPPVVVDSVIRAQLPPPRDAKQTDIVIDTMQVFSASLSPVTFNTNWCGDFEPEATPL